MADNDQQKKKLEELERLRKQRQSLETTTDGTLDVFNLDRWQQEAGDNWGGGGSGGGQPAGAPNLNWGQASGAISGNFQQPTQQAPQQQVPKPQGQGDNYEWAPPSDATAKDYAWVPPGDAQGNFGWVPEDASAKLANSFTPPTEVAVDLSKGVLLDDEGWADAENLTPEQLEKRAKEAEEARRLAELESKRAQQRVDYDRAVSLMQCGEQKTAMRLLKELASDGYPDAQFKLGVFYQKGQNITKDLARAAQWFEKAALQDHIKAQYNLGLMYKDGMGLEADYRRAIMWWELSAKQGHVNSQHNLVAICKQYAEKGDAACMYKLARMYFRGAGVEANKDTSYDWFCKAAKMEYPPAVYWLGQCFENGWGCVVDMTRAVRAYDHAFRLGLVEAGTKLKSSQCQQIMREQKIGGLGNKLGQWGAGS